MAHVIDPAWESIIVDRAATPLQPRKQARADTRRQLKLNRSARLLWDDNRSVFDLGTGDDIADLDLDQVAATQIGVEREVEKYPIAKPLFAVQEKLYRPDLLLREWPFGADHLICVSCRPVLHGGVVV